MTSTPLDSTHGRKTSGMTCQHRLWTTHTVERHWAWHAIIAFGQHTRSNDVGCGMTSPPLDSTNGRTTSGMTFHHRLWAAHTVKRRWRGMTSPPLDSTHGQLTSCITCHHRLWTPHSVKRHRVWHAIIAVGQHARSRHRAWHVITSH